MGEEPECNSASATLSLHAIGTTGGESDDEADMAGFVVPDDKGNLGGGVEDESCEEVSEHSDEDDVLEAWNDDP